MLVTPSILVEEIGEFWRQIDRLKAYYTHFQVDIVDGRFAQPRTIQIEEIVTTAVMNVRFVSNKFVFDIHLMVQDYEVELEKMEGIRHHVVIDTVFIHYSVLSNYSYLATKYPVYKIGIALNPQDSVSELAKKFDLSKVPAVQIMTVSPGAQGQEFLPDALQKIEQLRSAHYRGLIYLDGGINEKTLPIILSKKFVPDAIGPGSFFSRAGDIEERAHLLNELLSNQTSKI